MAAPVIVFDLDGTLVDTAPDLIAALNHTLRTNGFSPVAGEAVRDVIGRGARVMIETALALQNAHAAPPLADKLLADLLDHYEEHIDAASRPYPNAVAALDRFAETGWRLAVCTNKTERLADRLLERLGLRDRFAGLSGADTYPYRKPDPRHLLATIARAGGRARRALMVGDSRADIEVAKAAQVPVVGVTFGYSPVPMSQLKPDFLLTDFANLSLALAHRLIDQHRLTWQESGPYTPAFPTAGA